MKLYCQFVSNLFDIKTLGGDDMTLQQIKYVMVVVETGSINKAAESLYLSQPTLTNTIRSLEEDAGITIFKRTNKGVQLTSEGSDFIYYARKVCDQYDQLRWR